MTYALVGGAVCPAARCLLGNAGLVMRAGVLCRNEAQRNPSPGPTVDLLDFIFGNPPPSRTRPPPATLHIGSRIS